MRFGRKDLMAIIGLVLLTGAFVLLALTRQMSDMIFAAWLAAVTALLSVHQGANVASKKYKPGEGDG